jgi:hypothetical protein
MLGTVTYIYNPCYLGGGDMKIVVQGQPRQKLNKRPSLKNKLAKVVYTSNHSYLEGKGSGVAVQGWSRAKV